MIYLRCDDQEDPHSDILLQVKGRGDVIGHEAYALLDYIIETDEKLFHDIMRAMVNNHTDVILNKISNHSHYDDK